MAGCRALWPPELLFFTDERGPEVCTVGPAQMPSRGRGSQCGGAPSHGGGSTVTITFTGDTVRQQLVAHEARADDLLPRVSALLLAGPAAWNGGESEQMGAGSRTHTTQLLGFQFRLERARANSLRVRNIQRWAPHFGAHPLPPSTPPFPQETPPPQPWTTLGLLPQVPALVRQNSSRLGHPCRLKRGWEGPGGEARDAGTQHRHGGGRPMREARPRRGPTGPHSSPGSLSVPVPPLQPRFLQAAE